MNNRETFCLKWNEFETNIRESFRELREDRNYFDVTLATDDGQQIQAHKIILSAGSKFFNELLKKADHPSPFIYLKGINMVDIEYVVDFLYNGETNLPQEDLNVFLETAQEFQIKGLHNSLHNKGGRTQKSFTESPDQQHDQPQKIEEPFTLDSVDELADNSDVAMAQTMEEENYDIGSNQELDLQIERMIEREERMWKCKECGKTSKIKANMKQHAETHNFPCLVNLIFFHTCLFYEIFLLLLLQLN